MTYKKSEAPKAPLTHKNKGNQPAPTQYVSPNQVPMRNPRPRANQLPDPEDLPAKLLRGKTYTEQFLTKANQKTALRAAYLGLRVRTCAELIGMSDEQFRRLLKENEDFALEFRRHQRKGDFAIANTLAEVAIQDRDVRALIYLAKIRLGWTEKSAIEVSGPDGGPVETVNISVDAAPSDAAEEWARFRDAKTVNPDTSE